jgi:hypothetical protein
MTQQQKSAVSSAKQYLSAEAFSQQALIDQLDSADGSGYSVSDATVAVDSLNEDWNTEALSIADTQIAQQYRSVRDDKRPQRGDRRDYPGLW